MQREIVMTIISQLNLLLCLINDVLDLKMIEQGVFVARRQVFSPKETFDFILNIYL